MLILNLFTIISFLIVGAYATTDIKRLSKGASISVNDPGSYCDSCGKELLLSDQIPLISYLFSKGRCRQCGAKIPFSEFLFEFLIALVLSVISFLSSFSIIGYIITFLTYQIIKILYLIIHGFRKTNFKTELLVSSVNNIKIYLIIACIFIFQNALRN